MNNLNPPESDLTNLLERYQNGYYEEAEKLAIIITDQFPNHPFGWKVLSVLFGRTGRISESLDIKQKVVRLTPQDPEAYYNLGNTLIDLGRLEEAKVSYQKAITLNPDYAEAYQSIGIGLDNKGDLGAAIESYKKAIIIKPDYAEAHNYLGIALKKIGVLEEATVSYRQAIALNPSYAEAHYNLAITLKELGRVEEAEASHRQAITLKPDFAEAHSNLGVTLQELDRLEEAEASYRNAISVNPGYTKARVNLGGVLKKLGKYKEAIIHFDMVNDANTRPQALECLYKNKNFTEFNQRLNSMAILDGENIRVAAVSAFAAHQLQRKDPYPFCKNPLDFIIIENLAEHDVLWESIIDGIVKESKNYKLVWESRTTKFGFQGPNNVFKKPSALVSRLENSIRGLIDSYYIKFNSESNVFIKSWPKKNKLIGWFNRLMKNGYQNSHIHPGGWVSGVVYLKTIESPNNDDGAIEFGLHGYELPIIDKNYPRKLYRPKKGDIVLFPSSLFHRTIPFTSDDERCVIAFDLEPL